MDRAAVPVDGRGRRRPRVGPVHVPPTPPSPLARRPRPQQGPATTVSVSILHGHLYALLPRQRRLCRVVTESRHGVVAYVGTHLEENIVQVLSVSICINHYI